MKSILLPVFYLPPVSWFSAFLNPEYSVFLEKYENFPKQTYRNRANIYGANGALSLIIPICHTGKRAYRDTEISYREDWQKLHWKSIKTAYQSSPYFEFYEDRLQKIFSSNAKLLLDFNENALQIILEILKQEKEFAWTEEYLKVPPQLDLRNYFSAKQPSAQSLPEYYQTFSDKHGFLQDLSIIDLLCNKGPETTTYLKNILQID